MAVPWSVISGSVTPTLEVAGDGGITAGGGGLGVSGALLEEDSTGPVATDERDKEDTEERSTLPGPCREVWRGWGWEGGDRRLDPRGSWGMVGSGATWVR